MNRYVSATIASLAVFGVGCTVGWTGPAMKRLKQEMDITDEQMGWMAGTHETGRFAVAILGLFIAHRISPTKSMVGAALAVNLGWVLVATLRSVPVLFLSRFLFGVGAGLVFTGVPLYISDVAPVASKGALSTLFQAMLYIGHLYEFSIAPYLSYENTAWASLAVSIVWLLSSLLLRESPAHLVLTNQKDKAHDSLAWLLSTEDDDEIEHEIHLIEEQLSLTSQGSLREIFESPNRFKVALLCSVAVAQRMSGMSPITAYAATTFPSTAGGLNSSQYTILFGAVIVVCTLFATTLLDFIGRRALLITSCLGATVSHAVTAFAFGVSDTPSWLPFVSITSFSAFYAVGLGPIMNTLQGELPPPHLKWAASSLMVLFHASTSLFATKIFQVIADSLGYPVDFGVFALFCAISSVFAYCLLPETRPDRNPQN